MPLFALGTLSATVTWITGLYLWRWILRRPDVVEDTGERFSTWTWRFLVFVTVGTWSVLALTWVGIAAGIK